MNQYEKDQLERIKERLEQQIDKVPERVTNGSVQATRSWLKDREDAKKMLKRSGVGSSELLGMIERLQ